MKVYKKSNFIVLLLLVTVCLSGCSNEIQSNDNIIYDLEQKIFDYKYNKDKKQDDKHKSGINDKDITGLVVNGETIKLPIMFKDMEKAGWIYEGTGYYSNTKIIDEMPAQSSDELHLWRKDDTYLSTTLTNYSVNVVPYTECMVTELFYRNDYNFETNDIRLGSDIIVYQSVYDEVLKLCGKPYFQHDSDGYKSLQYKTDSEYMVKFDFNAQNNILTDISVRYYGEPDDIDDEVSNERPEFLDAYIKPEKMSDSPYDAVFELEGELYSLPCPVEQFIENGWKVAEGNEALVISGTHKFYSLKKNNIELLATLENPMDEAIYAKHSYVVELYVGLGGLIKVPFSMYGDISLDNYIDIAELESKFDDMQIISQGPIADNKMIIDILPSLDSESAVEYSMILNDGVVTRITIQNYKPLGNSVKNP